MTLAFLGKQSEDRISAAIRAGEKAAQFSPMLRLRFNSLGAFPNWKSPKTLWAGLGEGAEGLRSLSVELGKQLKTEGFELEEREFTAHATLGRVRSPKGRRELIDRTVRWRTTDAWEEAVSVIESLTLFESHLSPSGPAYIPLAEAKLAG